MAHFNAELYLRTLAENLLVAHVSQSGMGARSDLPEAASALVSCDLLDAGVARGILDGYARAFALRNRGAVGTRALVSRFPAGPPATPDALAPRRIYDVDATITNPRGLGALRLRWVSLSDRHVELGVSDTPETPANLLTAGMPFVEVLTPDGQRIEATFSGRWSRGQVHGTFAGPARVGAHAAWLSVDGTRVALERPLRGGEVAVETLDPVNPAVAYLWQLLADFTDLRSDPATGEAALGALMAAGLIAPDEPALEAIAWVRHRGAPERLTLSSDRPRPIPPTPPATVPAPWRGLATGRTGSFVGPRRTLPVGVVTPVFDRVCLAVNTLVSEPHSFSLALEISGHGITRGGGESLARNPVSLWAHDDRGNYYLGHISEWSAGHGSVSRGSVEFAALDPDARELTVLAQTARARASIRVPL